MKIARGLIAPCNIKKEKIMGNEFKLKIEQDNSKEIEEKLEK